MKSGAILYRAHFSARLPENQDRRARPPVFAATGLSRAKLMVIRVFATERRNRQKDGRSIYAPVAGAGGLSRSGGLLGRARKRNASVPKQPNQRQSRTDDRMKASQAKERGRRKKGANANSNLNLPSSLGLWGKSSRPRWRQRPSRSLPNKVFLLNLETSSSKPLTTHSLAHSFVMMEIVSYLQAHKINRLPLDRRRRPRTRRPTCHATEEQKNRRADDSEGTERTNERTNEEVRKRK